MPDFEPLYSSEIISLTSSVEYHSGSGNITVSTSGSFIGNNINFISDKSFVNTLLAYNNTTLPNSFPYYVPLESQRILIDTSIINPATPIDIRLPLISTSGIRNYSFVDIIGSASLYNITLKASGSDSIEVSGSDTFVLSPINWTSAQISNDGVNLWYTY